MVTLATITDQTVMVTARHAGQQVYLDGAVAATSTTPEQELRLHGTGVVELGWGGWDKALVVDGIYEGGWFVGSDGVASITDPLPPLAKVQYRARAYNAEGGWTDSDVVEVDARSCDVHINWGPTLTSICRAGWDPAINISTGRQKAFRRYVGDDDPSVVVGAKLPYQITTQITVDESTGDTPLPQWEAMSESIHPAVWRDSAGRIIHGQVTDFGADDSRAEDQRVSLTFTRTRQDA